MEDMAAACIKDLFSAHANQTLLDYQNKKEPYDKSQEI